MPFEEKAEMMTGAGFRNEPSKGMASGRAFPVPNDSGSEATAPLAVMLGGTGDGTVAPGTTMELSVTVTNRGDESAIIDIFLDDLPATLSAWVSSTQERVALGPEQSGEVVFHLEVPPAAMSGHYVYTLVVDAPKHYPDSPPFRLKQRLQILPVAQAVDQVNDPTFFLMPATRAASPAKLLPGGLLDVQVIVHNRGDRVDRFRLRCLDLPEAWLTVVYPQGFQQPGLSVLEQYLDLNPGEQDTISLQVAIPPETLAGSYVGTLQIQSENQPNLALLDLLYLSVLPVHQVTLSFRSLVSRVQQQPGVFAIQASNEGNTPRSLQFNVVPLDGGDVCSFTLEPEILHLEAQQTQTVRLLVQPTHPRQRPWLGGGKMINFIVEAEDLNQHPLPEFPMPGFLLWEARPWWQLLPIVLLGMGTVASIIGLLWWWLIRPPAAPQVMRLVPADADYSAANDDAVRLDFQVSHPERVQTLELVGQSPEGEIISGPTTFDLSLGLPFDLEPFCTFTEQALTCRNLLTDARAAGEYQFTLTALPKPHRGNLPISRLSSSVVAIAPLPQPEILAFESTQPAYPEPPPQVLAAATTDEPRPLAAPYGIRLNWAIAYPERLAGIQLTGFDAEGTVVMPALTIPLQEGLPEQLAPFCTVEEILICEDLQTGILQAGNYQFELTLLPVGGPPEEAIAELTPKIRVQARPPEILNFLVNGDPIQPKYIVRLLPNQPPPPLIVSWQVEANPGTTVELLPVPGDVAPQGSLPISLSPEADSTVITLQVTNSIGEQVNRSFALETIVVDPGGASGQPPAGAASSEGVIVVPSPDDSPPPLTAPRPTQPNTLSPAELPPQFD
jgi:hypothetical protein